MDQIHDLQTPSSLQSFIARTKSAGPASPIALIQFYNHKSAQWAASTLYQNQRIVDLFPNEVAAGKIILGRVDGSVLQQNQYSQYRISDTRGKDGYEVSYGLFWQGKQQVYEINALERDPISTVKGELDALLMMRSEIMVVGHVEEKRDFPVNDRRRRTRRLTAGPVMGSAGIRIPQRPGRV
ncbi:hypothetical protein TWF730_009025 [Orbilia blumenaviensis]|uniref:Uncharacterized protein n=1 Tax=Orbilia blumenaviensis TaxID=1796055 RepID=A0AAV9UZG6_9PEZI